MKPILSLAAAAFVISTAAYAQQTPQQPANLDKIPPQVDARATEPPPGTQAATSAAQPADITPGAIRMRLKNDLTKAGFTNVSVMPDSFLVQAKDKAGEPVTMIINPNSVTEVVADGSGNQNTPPAQDGEFTSVPPNDRLTSKIVGMNVYNDQNQDIGTIKDIAYSRSNVQAYILGVGGFLGLGDHYVAVSPSALKISYDAGNKDWRAVMNTTKDQLKAAPEYKYPSAT